LTSDVGEDDSDVVVKTQSPTQSSGDGSGGSTLGDAEKVNKNIISDDDEGEIDYTEDYEDFEEEQNKDAISTPASEEEERKEDKDEDSNDDDRATTPSPSSSSSSSTASSPTPSSSPSPIIIDAARRFPPDMPFIQAIATCDSFECVRDAHRQPRKGARFNFPHFMIIGWQKSATTSLYV
jgi:hypothetical protein